MVFYTIIERIISFAPGTIRANLFSSRVTSYNTNPEVERCVRVRSRFDFESHRDTVAAAFRNSFTSNTFPDGTQPMTDNPFPTASSSSTTTTGGVSFAEDPRAFYDKETGTWRLEDDDGNEFEYDQEKDIWVPLVRTPPSDLRPTICMGGRGTESSDAISFSFQKTC